MCFITESARLNLVKTVESKKDQIITTKVDLSILADMVDDKEDDSS